MSTNQSRHRHEPPSVVIVALTCASLLLSSASPAAAAPCWFPPVEATIVDPFRAPACTWCAGNRGIEYRVGSPSTVSVAASGRVEFSGAVVGVRYVVIRLANGWRHTYGQLDSTRLEVGDAVIAGGVVGSTSGTFFFGLRVGDDGGHHDYADPAPFIGELRGRPRLVPIDGTPARPGPPARPRCPASAAAATGSPWSSNGSTRSGRSVRVGTSALPGSIG